MEVFLIIKSTEEKVNGFGGNNILYLTSKLPTNPLDNGEHFLLMHVGETLLNILGIIFYTSIVGCKYIDWYFNTISYYTCITSYFKGWHFLSLTHFTNLGQNCGNRLMDKNIELRWNGLNQLLLQDTSPSTSVILG